MSDTGPAYQKSEYVTGSGVCNPAARDVGEPGSSDSPESSLLHRGPADDFARPADEPGDAGRVSVDSVGLVYDNKHAPRLGLGYFRLVGHCVAGRGSV